MTARAAFVVWTLALVCAAVATALIATGDHTDGKVALIALAVPTELAFVASGIVARLQRPQNRTGVLLILVGFSWFLGVFTTAGNPYLFTAGLALGTVFTAFLAHLFLAFPTGRLATRADRAIAIAFYGVVVLSALAFVFDEGDLTEAVCDGPCPENVLSVAPAQTVATLISGAYAVLGAVLAALVLARLGLRWRRASPALRRALSPVVTTAGLLIGAAVAQTLVGLVSVEAAEAVNWLVLGAILAVPLSFLYGLLRSRFGATTSRLVAELSEKRTPEEVQAVLRRALRDPTLELGYVAAPGAGYVGVDEQPLQMPAAETDRIVTRIGEAVLVHDASLREQPELDEVVHAARIALERGLSLRLLERREVDLRVLVEEQAALNRVALTVATEPAPERVFDVVTEEVARLLGADAAILVRFTPVRGQGVIVGKWSEPGVPIPPSGTINIPDGSALSEVARTGAPARMATDDPGVDPELHERLTALGVTSLVAAPIVVSGDIWGAVVVSVTSDQEFAPNAEARIGQFAGLVAVALANAQAREELATLADEQAALSRVAVAVATEERPERLFHAVSEEIGQLFDARAAATVRCVDDADEVEFVGGWQRDDRLDALSGVYTPIRGGAIARVRRTGRPARIDLENEDPDVRELMVAADVSSGVAAPIVVSGRLWGVTSITTSESERFPPDAEERLEKFTSLVAVALANAEAREELATLADEQAALSRVAVAVATEEDPERLFNGVSEEIGKLFDAGAAAIARYVDDADEAEIVGGWQREGQFEFQFGVRLPFQGGAITRVRQTGRTARIDLDSEPPDLREHMVAAGVSSGVAAPIVVSGRLWGATSISVRGDERFPPDAEERLEKFTSLVAVALANAEAREQLTASRARIVQAGDAERRRLERNLHDGAQQRLVTLALGLRMAQSRLPDDPGGAAELLARSSDELALGLEELRELARGIHPAILTDRGLTPAVEALAGRATVPVEVNGLPSERLPEPIEAAAFYVVSESLANVAKYAAASRCRVHLMRDDGLLVVEVSDDGVGGADAGKGSGLRGLSDRVEALGGRLRVSSAQGLGTTVRAELPMETPSPAS